MPLVIPKKFVAFFDVYVINSFSTKIVPAASKPVVESTVIEVPDPPVPNALSPKPGAVNVVVVDPKTLPPNKDIPHP